MLTGTCTESGDSKAPTKAGRRFDNSKIAKPSSGGIPIAVSMLEQWRMWEVLQAQVCLLASPRSTSHYNSVATGQYLQQQRLTGGAEAEVAGAKIRFW